MDIKISIIVLIVLTTTTYACDNTDEICEIEKSIRDYYEELRNDLPDNDKKILNNKCKFGGSTTLLGINGNPFLTHCPVIKDSLLGYWYNSFNYVTWQNVGRKNHNITKYNLKGYDLWIPKLRLKDAKSKYLCTVYTSNDCIQSIVKIKVIRKRCLEKKYELTSNTNIVDIYCSIADGYKYIEWWYKDSDMFSYILNNSSNNNKYMLNGNMLIINNVTIEDSGKYICKAYYENMLTNQDDIIAERCKILIIYPSQNHDFDVSVDNPILKVKLGETANTTCTAVGKSNMEKPYVEWKDPYDNNMPLYYHKDVVDLHDSLDSTMLYFINVTEEFIGKTFTCEASHYDKVKTVTTKIELDI
ncbi:IFN-alpha/beta-receptor-like secreted glycoprotein [NY_014 poxvirus]|uniref:IFN-alpha/beta-receptor-like secreted glycoprotein n=1 Tax=NY_014 poxvirus TaxID=2025360 RepID=UPI000B9A1486|nr:IFN-alpha/beta-receptor-like secreted glycoprotein [NY_014 poxvirus]AST09582.1 IFN-alpha/beta-receptor-like secreted glycoprotein [NY_014 poxvirus]